MSLRVVFDTSALVGAALRPDSIPDKALQVAIGCHYLCTSRQMLDELEAVLRRKKFESYVSLESRMKFIQAIRQRSLHVALNTEESNIRGACRDANDDMFLRRR
jgi:putative PIN family toxin of toxin-antitoxin system